MSGNADSASTVERLFAALLYRYCRLQCCTGQRIDENGGRVRAELVRARYGIHTAWDTTVTREVLASSGLSSRHATRAVDARTPCGQWACGCYTYTGVPSIDVGMWDWPSAVLSTAQQAALVLVPYSTLSPFSLRVVCWLLVRERGAAER